MRALLFLALVLGAACGPESGIDPCQIQCHQAQEDCGSYDECYDTWRHCMAICSSTGSPDHAP